MSTEMIAKPSVNTVARWGWACALVACIFIASGQSQVAAPHIIDFDKVAHFSVFGLLGTLVGRSLGGTGRRRWWAILIVSAYGACDEFRQSFTPGRSVELDDWLADTFGALTAVAVYQLWPAYRALMERPLFRRRSRGPAPVVQSPVDEATPAGCSVS